MKLERNASEKRREENILYVSVSVFQKLYVFISLETFKYRTMFDSSYE
jgi:hypothetical protein